MNGPYPQNSDSDSELDTRYAVLGTRYFYPLPPEPCISPLALKLKRDRFFQLGVLLVASMGLAALFAPWLAPLDPILRER